MFEQQDFLENVAYIKGSKHRRNLIKILNKNLLTPTEIGKALYLRPNHASNILADLRKKDLVYCATPSVHKGRLYTLTEKGEEVYAYLKEFNLISDIENQD